MHASHRDCRQRSASWRVDVRRVDGGELETSPSLRRLERVAVRREKGQGVRGELEQGGLWGETWLWISWCMLGRMAEDDVSDVIPVDREDCRYRMVFRV